MFSIKSLWPVLFIVLLFLTGLAGCGGSSASGSNGSSSTAAAAVTLTWHAPTTNTDGSSLDPFATNLQYRIYYGTSSGTYTNNVTVTDPVTYVDAANPSTVTVKTTLSLAPETYYFVVTCIDPAGQESQYSSEASKTLI